LIIWKALNLKFLTLLTIASKSMKADDLMIDKIASLARLEFKDEEKESIRKDMSQILTFVEKLNELDTNGIEPLIYMTEDVNVMRKDEVIHEINHEEALKNAPKKDSDYFRLPKVIGKVPDPE
jgi:aspartyl-tRNA(Asn)/glutamyl-tRNA(Gln) amidotransferase subunit C